MKELKTLVAELKQSPVQESSRSSSSWPSSAARTPLAVSGVKGLSNLLGTGTFSPHLHAYGAL